MKKYATISKRQLRHQGRRSHDRRSQLRNCARAEPDECERAQRSAVTNGIALTDRQDGSTICRTTLDVIPIDRQIAKWRGDAMPVGPGCNLATPRPMSCHARARTSASLPSATRCACRSPTACDQDAAVEQATAILRREGVVVLDHVVDPALLEACRQEIVARYPDYDVRDVERDLGSFPGRYTMPLVIDGLLAKRSIFAPRAIREIGRNLLSAENILELLGLLVSLAGVARSGRAFRRAAVQRRQARPRVAAGRALDLDAAGATRRSQRDHRVLAAQPPRDFRRRSARFRAGDAGRVGA